MPTDNQNKVLNLADVLFSRKMDDDDFKAYADGGVFGFMKKTLEANAFLKKKVTQSVGNQYNLLPIIKANINKFFETRTELYREWQILKNYDVKLPNNPFVALENFNKNRTIRRDTKTKKVSITSNRLTTAEADAIVADFTTLFDLIKKKNEHKLQLNTDEGSTTQVESFNVYINGYDVKLEGNKGDLTKFRPENVKDINAINLFDFSKRIPKIIFTSEYNSPLIKGTVIGWKKIADASSYTLTRRDVFDNTETHFKFTNEELQNLYVPIKEHVVKDILSFYNQYTEKNTFAVLDSTVEKNKVYRYSLTAHQAVKSVNGDSIFNVDLVPLNIADTQWLDIDKEIVKYIKTTFGQDTGREALDDVSAYPFISKKLYGTDKYDWILAAINVREAIKRKDEPDIIKSITYIGANYNRLKVMEYREKLFKPKDIEKIEQRIRANLASYGPARTLQEIINATGINAAFDQNIAFNAADTSSQKVQSLLSAIDTDTMTIDANALISNLLLTTNTNTLTQNVDTEGSAVSEFETIDNMSELDLSREVFDIASMEGISDFIRTIRLFFDLQPTRSMTNAK